MSRPGAAVGFTVSARPYADPDVTRMIAAAQDYYTQLYGTPDESEVHAEEFVPPLGRFLVGSVDGVAVATGAWRAFAVDVAEIKRMYVEPAWRGLGLARTMLAAVELDAVRAGRRRLVLVTGAPQQAAVALYRSAGYREAEPYGRYADSPSAVFLARDLVAAGSGAEPASGPSRPGPRHEGPLPGRGNGR